MGMMPDFVPRPGDFPNPYGDAADMLQLGIGSPDMTMAMGGFPQNFPGQDMWNVPMNFEWDWNAAGAPPPGQPGSGGAPNNGHFGPGGGGHQDQMRQ